MFNLIQWSLIRSVRVHVTHTIRMQTSKILHGWLLVMHMLSHMTTLAQYPGYLNTDETFDRLFQCPHPLLASMCDKIILALRKKELKWHAPKLFIDCVTTILSAHFVATWPDTPTHPLFAAAMEAQSRIGFNMFFRGYLATAWIAALDDVGTKNSF